jgi:hypothetical protein
VKVTKKQLRKYLLKELAITGGVFSLKAGGPINVKEYLEGVIEGLSNKTGVNPFIGRALPAANAPQRINIPQVDANNSPIPDLEVTPTDVTRLGITSTSKSVTSRKRMATTSATDAKTNTIKGLMTGANKASFSASDLIKADANTIFDANNLPVLDYRGQNLKVYTSVGPSGTDGDAGEHMVGNWCKEQLSWGDNFENLNGGQFNTTFDESGNLFAMSETTFPAFDCAIFNGPSLESAISYDMATGTINIDATLVSAKYTTPSQETGVYNALPHKFKQGNFIKGVVAIILGYYLRKKGDSDPLYVAVKAQYDSPDFQEIYGDITNDRGLDNALNLLSLSGINSIIVKGYGAINMSVMNYLTGQETEEALRVLPTLICVNSQISDYNAAANTPFTVSTLTGGITGGNVEFGESVAVKAPIGYIDLGTIIYSIEQGMRFQYVVQKDGSKNLLGAGGAVLVDSQNAILSEDFGILHAFREKAEQYLNKDSSARFPLMNTQVAKFIRGEPGNYQGRAVSTAASENALLSSIQAYENSTIAVNILGNYEKLYDVLMKEVTQLRNIGKLRQFNLILNQMASQNPKQNFQSPAIMSKLSGAFQKDILGILMMPFCKMLKNLYNKITNICANQDTDGKIIYCAATTGAQGLKTIIKDSYNDLMKIVKLYDTNSKYLKGTNTYELLTESANAEYSSLLNDLATDFKMIITVLEKSVELDIQFLNKYVAGFREYSSSQIQEPPPADVFVSQPKTLDDLGTLENETQNKVINVDFRRPSLPRNKDALVSESRIYENILKQLLKYTK